MRGWPVKSSPHKTISFRTFFSDYCTNCRQERERERAKFASQSLRNAGGISPMISLTNIMRDELYSLTEVDICNHTGLKQKSWWDLGVKKLVDSKLKMISSGVNSSCLLIHYLLLVIPPHHGATPISSWGRAHLICRDNAGWFTHHSLNWRTHKIVLRARFV